MKPLQVVHDLNLKVGLLNDCVLTPWLPLDYGCKHGATGVIVYSCVFLPY